MDFRFNAHDPRTGAFLYTLPRPSQAQIGDVFGERGTLELTYSAKQARAVDLPTFLEVQAQVQFDGGAWENVGPALIRLGGSHEDTDQAGMRTVQFVGREWLLGRARVGAGDLPLIDGKRPFYQASAGQIIRSLLLEAQDRGAADGIELGPFTNTTDSAGNAWSEQVTIYYSPGLPIGDVLANLVEQGVCDYRMEGRTLHVYEPDTALGRDLTDRNHPVRVHGAVTEAPVKYSLEDLANSALLIGEDGFQVEVNNPSAPDDYGRLEVTIEQGGVNQEGTARTLIDAELQRGSREIREITRTQHAAAAHALPYRDYRAGDYVQAFDDGQWVRYRVREIQVVRDAGGWTVHTVLNDRLQELLLSLAKKTNGIVNGSRGSGGDGTRPAPPQKPGVEPAAPQGLVIDQQVYLDNAGTARGVITAGWGEVTESTAGLAIDIGGYELWWRENDTFAVWTLATSTSGDTSVDQSPVVLTAGDGSAMNYQWRVRAIAQASNRPGPFSSIVTLTMTQDTTPPPPPSAPVVSTGFRIVTVEWDGVDENGQPMPRDFSRVRVYLAAAEDMAGARLSGSLAYPGSWNSETMPADVPVWVAMSAVDRVGNESAMTPAVSVTPRQLVDDEKIREELDGLDDTIRDAEASLREDIENIVIDDTGAVTYWLPTEPNETTDPPPKLGDIWFNTADGNKLSRHDGQGWVLAADERIQTVQDAQEQFPQDIADAEARALAEARDLANMTIRSGSNLIVNGSFEHGGMGWSRQDGIITEDSTARDGDHVLHIASSSVNQYPQTESIDARPGAVFAVQYWIRKEAGGTDPSLIRFFVRQELADGTRVSSYAVDDSGSTILAHGADLVDGEWTLIRGTFTADDPDVVTVRMGPHISSSGTAYDVDLVSALDQSQEANAAADARAKADAARDDAIAEAESKDQQVRTDIDQAIDDARTDLESEIATVRTSVDGKNRITQSVDAPPTQYDGAVGDRWERMSSMGSGGSLISNWRWNGNVWVSTIISDAVLGNVDAAKIGTGYLDAARIEAGSIYADKIVSGLSQNMVPDAGFGNSDINAQRLSRALGYGEATFGISGGVLTITTGGASPSHPNISLSGNDDLYAWSAYPAMKIVVSTQARAAVGVGSVIMTLRYELRDGTRGSSTLQGGYQTLTPEWETYTWEHAFPQDIHGFSVTLQVNRYDSNGTIEFRSPFVAAPTGTTLIEDGAVTTDKVLAGAIDAGKIAAGAVEAEHIVAGGIEAESLIVSGSVGETLIQDGAISTRTVQADAIGAEAIAAGVIDAGHIIAGGIQADSLLVPGSVGGTLIEDGAITTDKIEAGAITTDSAIFGEVDAGVLSAGEIAAARIGAQTITADKLLVGKVGNMLPNGALEEGSAALWAGDPSYDTSDKPDSQPAAVWWPGGTSTTGDLLSTYDNQVLVEPGSSLVIEMWVRATAVGSYFILELRDQDGKHLGRSGHQWEGDGNQSYPFVIPDVPNSWGLFRSTIVVPDGTQSVYVGSAYFNHPSGSRQDVAVGISGLRLRTQASATLIEDGAITTDKILANAITAGKIAALAIEADHIAANAIQADKIDAGAIDGKIITGATVRTNESGARVQLTAAGLRSYDSSGSQTFSINATNGAVEMTGNLVQYNSYGNVAVGPNLYNASDSSPAISFGQTGTIRWGYPGILLQGSGTSEQLTIQGSLTASETGSVIRLPVDGSSTNTGIWRQFGSGRSSHVTFTQGGDAYVTASGSAYVQAFAAAGDRRGALSITQSSVGLHAGQVGGQNVSKDLRLVAYGSTFMQARTTGNTLRSYLDLLDNGRVFLGGDNITFSSNIIYMNTLPNDSGAAPIGRVSGLLHSISSSRKYKILEEPISESITDRLLDVDPKTWIDRTRAERVADHLTAVTHGEEPAEDLDSIGGFERIPGVIAEDLHEAGLGMFVTYKDGEPESVMYDRIGPALIPIIRRLRDRVDALETQLGATE